MDEFHHRVRAGQYDVAARVLDLIDFDYLLLWGHAQMLIEWREQLLGKLTDSHLARINVAQLGTAYRHTGRAREAISCYEQTLQSARDDSDQGGIGAGLGSLGNAYSYLGETRKSVDYYEQALEIFRAIGDRRGEGNALTGLGIAYANLDETKAIDYYEQALKIARDIGNRRGEGNELGKLGIAYADLGDFGKAISYLRDALSILRETEDKRAISHCLEGMGHAHHHLSNLADARRCYMDALVLDAPTSNFTCAILLGILCREEGKADEARDYLARGIALCRALLDKTPNYYRALYLLAFAQLGSGQPDTALTTYRQALDICPAKGVVQGELQELRLLERAAQQVAGLAEVVALLEGVLGNDWRREAV